MSQEDSAVALRNDPYGIEEYLADATVNIVNEDQYSKELTTACFEAFVTKVVRDRSAKNKAMLENALAEACAKGTSAKRFNARSHIQVGSIGVDCTLGDFITCLPSDRDNNLRVWCESRIGFADRTYTLVKGKEKLRLEVSKANNCSLEMAPIAFDYAGSLGVDVYKSLGAVERQFIAANTNRKTGPARSHQFELESTDTGVSVDHTPGDVGGARRKLTTGDSTGRVAGLYSR